MGKETYSIYQCKCGKFFKGKINIERHISRNEIGNHCISNVKWINYRGEEIK